MQYQYEVSKQEDGVEVEFTIHGQLAATLTLIRCKEDKRRIIKLVDEIGRTMKLLVDEKNFAVCIFRGRECLQSTNPELIAYWISKIDVSQHAGTICSEDFFPFLSS